MRFKPLDTVTRPTNSAATTSGFLFEDHRSRDMPHFKCSFQANGWSFYFSDKGTALLFGPHYGPCLETSDLTSDLTVVVFSLCVCVFSSFHPFVLLSILRQFVFIFILLQDLSHNCYLISCNQLRLQKAKRRNNASKIQHLTSFCFAWTLLRLLRCLMC